MNASCFSGSTETANNGYGIFSRGSQEEAGGGRKEGHDGEGTGAGEVEEAKVAP